MILDHLIIYQDLPGVPNGSPYITKGPPLLMSLLSQRLFGHALPGLRILALETRATVAPQVWPLEVMVPFLKDDPGGPQDV